MLPGKTIITTDTSLEAIKKSVRNKAIDEFAEKLCNESCEQAMTVVLENKIKADILTLDGVTELAWEIAEQMKGGE